MFEGKRRGRLTPARRRVIDQLVDQWLDADPQELNRSLIELQRRAPRIFSWVASLLVASKQPTQFLQTLFQRASHAVAKEARPAEIRLPIGTRLGAWRLIDQVGQGGMGTVYRAERADGAFAMQAAVKLIRLKRPGLNQRLESERALLARLDHRHIARLIDGGASDEGLAYLVMEWVNGEDLDCFVQRIKPSLSMRLDLFEQIAEAVAHAHQRRVVHGDLKPANVRVTENGKARLLDFGVARLVEEEGAAIDDAERALTPAYCAPEQLDGEPASTLSDVWSLGTLLSWLLQQDADEGAPATPQSDRLLNDLPRRADIVAIVGRARSRQPEKRYDGVVQLLEDLRRYRRCQAVSARRPTRRYVSVRLIQRHRLAAVASLMITLTIGLALGGMAWQARDAMLERNIAQIERDRAQAEADKTRQVSDFVVELFRQANPGNHQGEELTATELARIGLEQIEMVDASPEVQADFLLVLSRVEQALGNYPQAAILAERAVKILPSGHGQADGQLAQIQAQLGSSLTDKGEFERSEEAHRRALDLLADNDPDLRAEILSSLGISLRRQGRFDDAIEVLDEALAYWIRNKPGSTSEATARNNLAIPLFRTGQVERSGKMFEAALDAYRNALGSDHPLTATAVANLGAFFLNSGQLDEAENHLRESLELRQRLFGPDHPQVANSLHALGRVALEGGQPAAAERWFAEANQIRTRTLGEDHFSLAPGFLNLGMIATRLDQLDLAQERIDRAEKLYRASHGADHPVLAELKHARGDLAMARGESARAANWHERAVTLRRAALGDENPSVIRSMIKLARAHRDGNNVADALRWATLAERLSIEAGEDPVSPQRSRIAALQKSLSNGR